MAVYNDKYLIEINAKLVGDEVFQTLTNRIKQLENEAKNAGRAVRGTGDALRSAGAAGGNAAAGLGKMGSLFQNMSYQITDFAVQTQGGVSAMRAFSQQAPQMAGALGAAGIGGAAGVAGFAIASLLAALAPAALAMLDLGSAAEKAQKQMDYLADLTLDFGGNLPDIEKTADGFKKLSEAAREAYEIQKKFEQQRLALQISAGTEALTGSLTGLKSATAAVSQNMNDAYQSASRYERVVAQGALTESLEDLRNEFGLTADQAKLVTSTMQGVFDAKDDRALYNALLDAATAMQLLQDANGGVNKYLNDTIKQVTDLAGIVGKKNNFWKDFEDTGLNAIRSMTSEWDALIKKFQTPLESFNLQIVRVDELAKKLNKSAEEAERLKNALRLDFAQSEYDRLVKDTETYAGGVLSAVDAVDKLGKNLDYVKGLQTILNQFDPNTKEWQAIAEAMKDSADPATQFQRALNEIRNTATDTATIQEQFEKWLQTVKATPEEIEKVREKIKGLKDDTESMYDVIGHAIGDTLSSQVSKFTDTLFDAEASFSDMAASMLEDIAKLIVQLTILRTLEMALEGTSVGNFLGIKKQSASVVTAPAPIITRTAARTVTTAGAVPATYSSGPLVSAGGGGGLSGLGGSTVVNITNNSGGNATVTETSNPSGGRTIDVMIESAVDSAIARGRFDKTFGNGFGLRRRGY